MRLRHLGQGYTDVAEVNGGHLGFTGLRIQDTYYPKTVEPTGK